MKLFMTVKSKYKLYGREREIRTPGGVTLAGFQDQCIQPLCHLPTKEKFYGGDTRIRTGDQGFAGPCLSHLAMSPPKYTISVVPEAGLEPAQLQ